MQRRFTKDVGKHFREGQIEDYPHTTWINIARSGQFDDLEDFSIAVGVDENPNTSATPAKKKKTLRRKKV